MRIHIKGGGWYGSHLALALRDEHSVVLTEVKPALFRGASGSNPARLHRGPHYPRSYKTREACRTHTAMFMKTYGHLTRDIPNNIYAIAAEDSMVDFGTYAQVLGSEIETLTVHNPAERGLQNVEGAIQVNERHIIIREAREFFTRELADVAVTSWDEEAEIQADLVIDCTFCQNKPEALRVDRYEPCITVLLEGRVERAITIMDGPFPSLYPWDEGQNLSSLTSAKYTPLGRYATWREASDRLLGLRSNEIDHQAELMISQMERYFPPLRDLYRRVDCMFGIRAMPKSGADARLVEVTQQDEADGPTRMFIRAGKIDAVFDAEREVRQVILRMESDRRSAEAVARYREAAT